MNNTRGKQSSIPPLKMRPDSPVPTLKGPCDRSLEMERNPEVPDSTRDEALFHYTKNSGGPRGPSQINPQYPDFSQAPLEAP